MSSSACGGQDKILILNHWFYLLALIINIWVIRKKSNSLGYSRLATETSPYKRFPCLTSTEKLQFNKLLMVNNTYIYIEKKKEIWLSPMTKTPSTTEKSKKQRDNTKTPPKTSITQRLRTDLGRSVGVTIATQLVWLNRFMGSQPSHSPQQLCNRGYEDAGMILQSAEIWKCIVSKEINIEKIFY